MTRCRIFLAPAKLLKVNGLTGLEIHSSPSHLSAKSLTCNLFLAILAVDCEEC
jgi:hypothetical protein